MARVPLGKRFLTRKCSNVENLPPVKAEVLVSARKASRRRRARIFSGQLPLKVKNSQRRATKAAQLAQSTNGDSALSDARRCAPSVPAQVVDAVASASATKRATAKVDTLTLPRFLRRPAPAVWPHPFERENIDACHPDLAGVDFNYIMQGLEITGQSMWHVVKTAHVDRSCLGHRTSLPDEVNVTIPDYLAHRTSKHFPTIYPTHVLAIWQLEHAHPVIRKPESDRCKVSLVPVHNLVLAMHCAKWFKLPPSSFTQTPVVDRQGVAGTRINLPLVPLAVPHPESFLLLLQTMYVHKVTWLMDQLVPIQKPAFTFATPENPAPQNPHYILESGRRLAARYTYGAIMGMIGTVVGLWQNAVYLGVSDRRLWTAMDWSYDMLLTGLGYSLGCPGLVPRPQPSKVCWAAVQPAKA